MRRLNVPTAQQASVKGFPGGFAPKGGVGIVRVENLDAASRQLARNAAYGKHGPGICSSTAAHSKFMAVGTSRGLILLFDHFQVRRGDVKDARFEQCCVGALNHTCGPIGMHAIVGDARGLGAP